MDQNSPETPKSDFYDTMPNPQLNSDLFDKWLEQDLLAKVDTVPEGYGDSKADVKDEQLLNELKDQVRMQVYQVWIPGYTNEKRPQLNRPPRTYGELKEDLRGATSGFISEFKDKTVLTNVFQNNSSVTPKK